MEKSLLHGSVILLCFWPIFERSSQPNVHTSSIIVSNAFAIFH